jgi:putative ABC transport system permease protein
MRFTTFVFRNVFRRRIRSTLTMTGIAVAVAAVVALVGSSDSFARSFLAVYSGRGIGLVVSRKDAVNPMAGVMDEKIGDEIAKVDGVEATCPGLVDALGFENLGLSTVLIQGWPAGAYMFGEEKMLHGESLTAKDVDKRAMMIGKELAEKTKLKVGATVSMSDEDFHVVGIYESISDLENNMAIMLLADAQRLTGKKGQITGCTVRIKDSSPETVKRVQAEIEGPLAVRMGLKGKINAKPPTEFVQSSKQVNLAKGMAWATSAVALFISVINILNTMIMSVFERTREIGILRAIGWRPSRVMRMILMESLLLSVGGGVLGAILGIGVIWLISRMPIVNGATQGAITPTIMLEGFAIALIVGLIGAAYPAYRGARLLPTEALRHE